MTPSTNRLSVHSSQYFLPFGNGLDPTKSIPIVSNSFLVSAAEKAPYFPISAVEKARYFVMASRYPGRLPGLLLAFTAGLLVPSRASLALRATLAGTVLTLIMLFYTLASVQAIDATDRYVFPYGLAYFLAVSLIVAGAMAYPTMKPARSMIAMAPSKSSPLG